MVGCCWFGFFDRLKVVLRRDAFASIVSELKADLLARKRNEYTGMDPEVERKLLARKRDKYQRRPVISKAKQNQVRTTVDQDEKKDKGLYEHEDCTRLRSHPQVHQRTKSSTRNSR